MQNMFICIANLNHSSMRMHVCLFLILPIVIEGGLQSQALSTHVYTKVTQYSGYACRAQNRVFEIHETRSRSDCIIVCAQVHGCSAIFHVESSKRCIGCNSTTFDRADVFENVTDSECYVKGSGCKEGWIRYSNSCYYFNFNKTMNFNDSKEYCSRMGAHVIVPDDDNENQFIRTMIPPALAHWGIWIGIEQDLTSTWFSYHDNKTVNYVNWDFGEPNGGMAELCAAWGEHKQIQWHDVPCDWIRNVACEI